MAHQHTCKFCEESFVCELGADVCFKDSTICQECHWTKDFRRFVLILVLGAIAAWLTLLLISLYGGAK